MINLVLNLQGFETWLNEKLVALEAIFNILIIVSIIMNTINIKILYFLFLDITAEKINIQNRH